MRRVASGLDRWIADGAGTCGLAPGARLGVLAHAASIDARGRHLLEWLRDERSYTLERLFAPEHGLWGHEQDMETVAAANDPFTGLPVRSLYGADRASLRPQASDLLGLDAIVVDLQDIGSRYYTFVYTLAYVMEAAAEARVPVVVLDRPNPIDGEILEGPLLDPALASFVGRFALPVRHGMTIGELAQLFREREGIDCELRVVPLEGWQRSMQFEDTGLPWVPPSPNMPRPETARVYPGGCLIEGTNLSEGRGTTLPFELVGAPWLDGHALARELRGQRFDGLVLRAASFRPMFQKHAGRACAGVQLIVTDPARLRSFAVYLALLAAARRQAPAEFSWRSETYEFESARPAIDYLLGRDGLREMLEQGASVAEMERTWERDLRAFESVRRPFLLY
jgi:uncharacterized protein YbbC (DUF1343 family)